MLTGVHTPVRQKVASAQYFRAHNGSVRSNNPDKKGDQYAGTHGNGQYPKNYFQGLYNVKNNFFIKKDY